MSVASDKMPGGYYDPYTGDRKYDVSGNRGDWNAKNPATDASWSGALNALADAGYDVQAIYDMISGYLSSGKGQSTERNDMFYQYLLGEISKQNTRDYDYKRYLEQLQYNLPTNELQRLMATGMSRDAAFKMLAGAAGGAGSLVGSGGTGTNASVSGPSGSAEIARTGMAVNAAVSVSDAMCNMVNTGMNAYGAYQQANLLNAQATMAQDQLQAYQLTGQAYNLIQEGVNRGVIDGQDGHVYDSVQSAQAALEALAKAGNTTAQEWHANGTIKQLGNLAPYSSEFLSNLYKSERSGRDYATLIADQHRREENLNKLNQVQLLDVAQGIEESKARIHQIATDENYKNECIELVRAQAERERKLGKQVDVEMRVQRAQAILMEQEAQMNSWLDEEIEVSTSVGTGKMSGASLFKMEMLEKHKAAAWTANKLNNDRYWEKVADNEMSNVDMLISTNLLRHYYNEVETSALQNMTPQQQSFLGLCSAYSSGHVFDYMDRLLQSSTSKSMMGTTVDWNTRAFIETPANGLPVIPLTTPYIKMK